MAEPPGIQSVSVIVPTRNRSARLRKALESVLCQSIRPMEIIVVDDASTDDTQEMLAHLCATSDFTDLRAVRNDLQRGASYARNVGIAAARGSMLAFLDDDDRWLPDKLVHQTTRLSAAADRVGLVCCAYRVVSERTDRTVRTWHPPAAPMDVAYFLRTTGFMTTIPLIRRICFEEVGGFDEALAGSQDLDMWIRIAERYEVVAVSQVLAEHRIHGDQITADLPTKAKASAQILRKHRQRYESHPDLLRRHLERAALLNCAVGELDVGRGFLREAIALAPERDSLRDHLRRSLHNPADHAAELLVQAFRDVDGVKLYY